MKTEDKEKLMIGADYKPVSESVGLTGKISTC